MSERFAGIPCANADPESETECTFAHASSRQRPVIGQLFSFLSDTRGSIDMMVDQQRYTRIHGKLALPP